MYTLIYHHAVKKDVSTIPAKMALKIRQAIENKITVSPFDCGVPLRGALKSCYKLRVGDYRIIYDVLSDKKVLILIIAHRREVYQVAERRR